MQKVKDIGQTGAEILGGLNMGQTQPLRETAELTGRAALNLASNNPLTPGTAVGVSLAQAPRIAAVEQQQAQRRAAGPTSDYWRRSQAEKARIATEEAEDPALSSRILRGVTRVGLEALPTVAVGAVTGGSVPAMAAVSGLMSLDDPTNIPTAVTLGALPAPAVGPAIRAGREAIRRTLGRGVEQIVEAEAKQAGRAVTSPAVGALEGGAPRISAVAPSISSQVRAVGPSVAPSSGLTAAIEEAAAEVPASRMRQALSELASFPRAMMSSLDISAPGRQGLILSVAPSRWGAAVKAGGRMFQAFKPKHYDRIKAEIANHADAGAANDAGLYLAFRAPEELFTSRLAGKVPGVTASQRAYESYLDSLRMSIFSQYKKVIDAQGLAPLQTEAAYKAAANWINIATGRGSFGKKFDDATGLLSQFLFAPKYMASRFNVFNPVMYYRNFKDPATRAVGKMQMKDLAQYLGTVGLTMGVAKMAGADVGLDPNKGDFLKIRIGSKVFDPGAGLTQIMRFAIRTSLDLGRAAKGEKAEYGQDAGSLALKFIRSKVAPLPGYAWDFFSRKTYEGKDFTPGQAALGVVERVTPLTWSDFTEAVITEGWGSAAGTLPSAAGISVQSYTDPGGHLEKMQPLYAELQRLGKEVPEIRRMKDEPDAQFDARVKVFGEALETYGLKLAGSQEYRTASDEHKRRMLDLLPRRISSALMRQGETWQLEPRIILDDVKDSADRAKERQREEAELRKRRGY